MSERTPQTGMASTPIRIRDEDRARLDRLRAALAKASGERPSPQEVLGRAVRFAEEHEVEFLREREWKPLSAAAKRRLMAMPEDLGDGSSRDIDDIVYGERP